MSGHAPPAEETDCSAHVHAGGDEALLQQLNRTLFALAKSRAMKQGDLTSLLKTIAATTARTLRVEKVSVWFSEAGRSRMLCKELYHLKSDEHLADIDITLRANYPRYFEALEKNRSLVVHDARNDPRTSELAEVYLSHLGITSIMDMPIRLGGNLIGILCHEHIGPARQWNPAEQYFAAAMADFVALAVESRERAQTERALTERERQLATQNVHLEEVNTALKILLQRIDSDKSDLEAKILSNMKELVLPHLEKLKKSGLDARQSAHLHLLETNLLDVTSPFTRSLSAQYFNLSPSEVQVANHVRHGKATKAIAAAMNLSVSTIEVHRRNIRRKMNLRNKKVNLRTHLNTFK